MISSQPRILVIDDQYGRSSTMQTDFLKRTGLDSAVPRYHIEFCAGQESQRNSIDLVLAKIREGWPPTRGLFWSLVILDVRFDSTPPDGNDARFGFTILKAIRDAKDLKDLPVIMLTREDVRGIAGQSKADGFLPKTDLTVAALNSRVWRHGLIQDDRPAGLRLVGQSFAFLDALRKARKYAIDQVGGLIFFGETGTGKTEFALYVHEWASRQTTPTVSPRKGPFMKWTAIAQDTTIAQAELFGFWDASHVQANRSEPGAMEKAHEGTFLLDEVAYLTPDLQGLLIDARRRDKRGYRTIKRMGTMPTVAAQKRQALATICGERGEHGAIKVNVLFLAATNIDLWDEEIRKHRRFRQDLLNDLGARVFLPSLNQQRDDIPILFQDFAQLSRDRLRGQTTRNLPPVHVAQDAQDYLQTLDWTNRNIVTLKALAEQSVGTLGVDFDTVTLSHVASALQGLPINTTKTTIPITTAPTVITDTPPPLPPAPPQPSPDVSLKELSQLIKDMADLHIPQEQSLLRGILPRLQDAYARLVLRVFGAALLATQQSGGASTLEAVRLLLDKVELRPDGLGDATKAYDVVKRLVLLADTSYARRSAKSCPILTDDKTILKHVSVAIKR